MKIYNAKNFESLLGMGMISDPLLRNHFTLYEGYVKNVNTILGKTESLKESESSSPEYAEMKRRLGWEYNGMRLHELYFGNMKKDGSPIDLSSAIAQKIAAQWGSFDTWKKEFIATGSLRGIGWAVLVHDKETDTLFNAWINEHDVGNLVNSKTLLVMDVFEHAFILDFGTKRADYINTFFSLIDWSAVNSRL